MLFKLAKYLGIKVSLNLKLACSRQIPWIKLYFLDPLYWLLRIHTYNLVLKLKKNIKFHHKLVHLLRTWLDATLVYQEFQAKDLFENLFSELFYNL